MNKNILAFGICFLLLCSVFIPIGLGYDVKSTSIDRLTINYNPSFENPPNEIWNKTYGGKRFEEGKFLQQTRDDGYIIVGVTMSYGAGDRDIWLIKTDINGNELWNKSFGGPYEDLGFCVRETSDGGFIITGKYDTKEDWYEPWSVWLIKTDENGNLVWENKFRRDNAHAIGNSVIEVDDGYVVLGEFSHHGIPGKDDIWLIKTDFDGNEQWNKFIGSSKKNDYPHAVIQTRDGDFVIVGATRFYLTEPKVLLIKTDFYGNIKWRKELDGIEGYDIKECNDGGYIISCWDQVSLLKTDKNGNIQWIKNYGFLGYDKGLSVDLTLDGGFILSGVTAILDYGDADMLIIKTNENGVKEWEKIMGETGRTETGFSIIQSSDGNYVITGENEEVNTFDTWLVKVAPFENPRPNKPNKPIGITHGSPNIVYNYTTNSSGDPDGELVWYTWAYEGLGINYNRIGPYFNDEWCEVELFFPFFGSYKVIVKTIDIYGGESDWSEPLKIRITIPRNKVTLDSVWLRFFDMFPILERILNCIL